MEGFLLGRRLKWIDGEKANGVKVDSLIQANKLLNVARGLDEEHAKAMPQDFNDQWPADTTVPSVDIVQDGDTLVITGETFGMHEIFAEVGFTFEREYSLRGVPVTAWLHNEPEAVDKAALAKKLEAWGWEVNVYDDIAE